VGAVVGILFPPAILVDAAIGGLAGGAIGHSWRGMSRKDVKEPGELLDEGDAALLAFDRRRRRLGCECKVDCPAGERLDSVLHQPPQGARARNAKGPAVHDPPHHPP